jgi:uncharacterized protein
MTYTVFAGHRRLGSGRPEEIVSAVRERLTSEPVLIFEDSTGGQIDLDLRGTAEEIRERYAPPDSAPQPEKRSGPGRPKLGVVSREVSLLPRHWEWLGGQPGGASAAIRRLVEAARRDTVREDEGRRARDAAHRFMYAMAGDLPGFEEASRALYAGDFARLDEQIQPWPGDVRDYVRRLLLPAARAAEFEG